MHTIHSEDEISSFPPFVLRYVSIHGLHKVFNWYGIQCNIRVEETWLDAVAIVIMWR